MSKKTTASLDKTTHDKAIHDKAIHDKTTRPFQVIDEIKENAQLTNDVKKGNRFPAEFSPTVDGVKKRLDFLKQTTKTELDFLTNSKKFSDLNQLQGNIENYVGMSMMPTGVIGPVKVIGSAANGDFFVPLATSEGALVASYHRGAKACYVAGGVTSICLLEAVQRSPVFKFHTILDVGIFVGWLIQQIATFKAITAKNSRFAKLIDMRTNIEGNYIILTLEYETGDAAGQNMVTLCTDAICHYIVENAPIKPLFWAVEGNYSGDKKATALSFTKVRGKKVTTEIVLSEKIVNKVLKSTPELMVEYWRAATMGVIQSGAMGAQGHYANGLAALFIATGQDAACVAEASIGITRMELNKDGSLYTSVTLPNLIVGTVGGGTSLPTQRECLELMGCYGAGNARKFAEICGAVILAGELSIAAALSAGHFSSAHRKFGRKNNHSLKSV